MFFDLNFAKKFEKTCRKYVFVLVYIICQVCFLFCALFYIFLPKKQGHNRLRFNWGMKKLLIKAEIISLAKYCCQ
jgi:hypothetical protein